VPLGADGEGFYSRATRGCFDVIANASTLVLDSVDQAGFADGGRAFAVCDYGTADGGTSLPLVHNLVGKIKETYGKDQEVHVQYEDQPNNEWRSVFNHTQGIVRIPGVPLYTEDYEGVFVTASGTSFHDQCFPSNSLNLGMAFTCMHWLSERPGLIADRLHSTQAAPAEKALYQAQAAKDWERTLLARARELAPGGRIVIVNFCESADGYYLGWAGEGANMYSTMSNLWRELVTDGTITEEEFAQCSFPNHYRTLDEHTAPFKEGTPVWDAGLRLVSIDERVVPCPFRAAWVAGEAGTDPVAQAKDYVPTLRTWSNSVFLSALSEERPLAEREAIVERFFEAYEAEVAKDPAQHGMDYVHAYIVLEKVAA